MAKGKGDNKSIAEGLKGLIGMSPGKTAGKKPVVIESCFVKHKILLSLNLTALQ